MKSKKILGLLGAVALAIVLTLAFVPGCAKEAPAPAPAPAPEAMEPQQWDMITYEVTLEVPREQIWLKATQRIKERTNGLLDIRYVPAGALPIKPEDWLRAVSKGDLAICNAVVGYAAGDYPSLEIVELPFVYTNTLEREIAWNAVFPIYQRELAKENLQILSLYETGTSTLAVNKPVDLMDLKGLKIRTYGTTIPKMVETMGGVAAPLALSETYSALEKGVVDGVLTGTTSIYSAGLHKLAPYFYDIGWIMDPSPWIVNKELWDALPKEIQNIVYEELGMACSTTTLKAHIEIDEMWEQMLAEVAGKGCDKVEVAPPGFADMMREKVTKPMVAEQLVKNGALGEELITALEEALGISLR